jgi:hypothetical protein
MTTYTDLQRALRGLGEGRWISPGVGPALRWPDDLDIGVDIAWGQPTAVEWLNEVASLVQPIDAQITHRGTPALTLPGHIVWPGWDDLETDPHHHGTPYVVAIPDEQARLVHWQARSLAAALSWLHGIEPLPIDALAERLGFDVLEGDSLASVGAGPHPWADEWLAGEGF